MEERKRFSGYLSDDSDNSDLNKMKSLYNGLNENDEALHEFTQPLENYDSEDEVMEISCDLKKEKKISATLNLEDHDDSYVPNKKAWGKHKKAFYLTDYVDADYSFLSEKENVFSKMEEREAKNLQKLLSEQLDETDFGIDLLQVKEQMYQLNESSEFIKTDFRKLGIKQKQKLLDKDRPEFIVLMKDLQGHLIEEKSLLVPCLKIIEAIKKENYFISIFIKKIYNLSLYYCMNIFFYMVLVANKKNSAAHPIIKRLRQYRLLFQQLITTGKYPLENLKVLIHQLENKPYITESIKNFGQKQDNHVGILESLFHSLQKSFHIKSKKKQEKISQNLEIQKCMLSKSSSNLKYEIYQGTVQELGKRAITYQISKNKGLTPHRKKELRNPRVKHRNAYRKATIHRRGAIRVMRKENNKYEGEISGVKASLLKSIKLK